MRSSDLPHWTDGNAESMRTLREALRDARADAPSEAQLGRMIASVHASLGTPGVPQVATDPSPKLGWSHVVPAAGGVIALVAAVTLAALAYSRVAAPVTRSAAAINVGEEHPTPAATAAPSAGAVPASRALPNAASAPAVAVPPLVTLPSRGAPPMQARPLHIRNRKHRLARTAVSDTVDVAGELRLLGEAKRELTSAPEHGYALLQQHRQTYPSGQFVEEREALTIEALYRLGRQTDARDHAATFRSRFPRSAYLRRVDDVLSGRVGTHE
jgi:hypothetical protein